ncbi:Vps5-like protein [Phytophthora infestans]|uniref:Vps5 C terminal like n=1 Tax=Phytophthora infestans TaxID=4787 RepID=A0A833T6E2_PHYIN|nr:Vps5-like protein [Phytophthora infestans]KAF4150658.1 Vps5 C terminal like [Phytophthora infestans]
MEGRNGKWVNVDYTNRIMEESAALPPGGSAAASATNSGLDDLTPFLPASDGQYDRSMSSLNSSSASSARGEPPSNIQVTVSEPVKQGEGMNAYISYKISLTTTRPQFSKSSFSVVRRYSDFVWIHGHLSALYPGVVVPPLPEKLLVGRFSPEFIESRRRALQLFLQRCCLHPELQHSEHLTTFLEASEDQLQAFRKDPRHAAPNAQRGVLFQWLDDTVNTISSTLITPATNLPKTPADIEVEDMMAYIEGLEPIMTGLHKHAHGLTKRAREIADGLFEFGVSFTLLGKSEENPSLQEGLNHIGHCSDKLSILAAEHAEREALHFEEPIFDYIRLVGAVKAALQKRNEVRCAYGAAVANLEAKEAALSKLLKHTRGGSSEEKVQVAESEVRTAQQQMEDAKLEDDIVTERVLREVERFKREKLADFKLIILDYIQMQIEYSKKVEEEWQKVIPHLTMIHVENGGSPVSSMSPVSEATNGSFQERDAHSASIGPVIQEDYIPSNGDLADSLADLTLMANDSADEDPFQRSPYGSRPLEDSNPDVSL